MVRLLSFVCFILLIDSFNMVRILGLFPDDSESSNDHWTTQCMAMFRAAIVLANRYEVTVHGQPINYTIFTTTTVNNGFTELEFVCRSVTNITEHDVVGIIGPTSSTNARFLAPFAAHLALPLVSYASTNAELNDRLDYSTFYRTVPSDALLAEAIVQLFKHFSWKTCAMILGKDDYGYGGLELLSETYNSNVSIEERLIYDPRTDKFQADLKETLGKSRSCIVLVWTNQSSSTRIIQHAINEKLLGGSYVWLMTNKISLNAFNRMHWHELEGILAVIPTIDSRSASGVNETLQNEAFKIWRDSPDDQNSLSKDLSSISPFAMYTFDAVWTLIQALNKSSFNHSSPSMYETSYCFDSLLQNHSNYHMHLQQTQFLGVSGMIQFNKNKSNDRVSGSSYALYNVQWIRQRHNNPKQQPNYEQIMRWHEEARSWNNCSNKSTLTVWPSEEFEKAPTDYPQLKGQHLKILVIEAPPFIIVRNISPDYQVGNSINTAGQSFSHFKPLQTRNPNTVIYGFVADLIRELQSQMHFNYTIDVANLSTTYHSLVASMAKDDRQYDMILSDVRITSSRMLTVGFSSPFYESTLRIVTRQHAYSSSFSMFSSLNPFTWDVWIAILAVMTYSGFLIYLFEYQSLREENGESSLRAILTGICQVLSSVIIMSGDVRLTTHSSRLIVLGLYALGVILIATYTANLSSFLTLSYTQPFITGIDDIKNGRLSFSRIGIIIDSAVSDYYIQNISSRYYPLASADEMYLRLLDHTIDASIWESSIIEYAVNNYYCDQLTAVGAGFVKSPFGIVLTQNWLYKKDLDIHILAMRESERLEYLENVWVGQRQSSSSLSTNADNTKRTTFSLDIVGGLFLIFLMLTIIAFGVHLWHSRVPITVTLLETSKRIGLRRKKDTNK